MSNPSEKIYYNKSFCSIRKMRKTENYITIINLVYATMTSKKKYINAPGENTQQI